MTVLELEQKKIFEKAAGLNGGEQKISAVYCCDMLSVAMSHAPAGCAWVTVVGNVNTLAAAVMAGAACVILAEGIQMEPEVFQRAEEKGIFVFLSKLPVFETALKIHKLL